MAENNPTYFLNLRIKLAFFVAGILFSFPLRAYTILAISLKKAKKQEGLPGNMPYAPFPHIAPGQWNQSNWQHGTSLLPTLPRLPTAHNCQGHLGPLG